MEMVLFKLLTVCALYPLLHPVSSRAVKKGTVSEAMPPVQSMPNTNGPTTRKKPIEAPSPSQLEHGARIIVQSISSNSRRRMLRDVLAAIKKGDGAVVVLALEFAFDRSNKLGRRLSKVIAVAVVHVIDSGVGGRDRVAAFFSSALTTTRGKPRSFARILSGLVQQQGCQYLRSMLHETETLAVRRKTDDLLVANIYKEAHVTRCLYSTCKETEACCNVDSNGVNFCRMCPLIGFCDYQQFGGGIRSVLKRYDHNSGTYKKCVCAR